LFRISDFDMMLKIMEPFDVMIVGAGMAGTNAALVAAARGRSVALVDREQSGGGKMAAYGCKAGASCNKCYACLGQKKIDALAAQPGITRFFSTELTSVTGAAGDFTAAVVAPEGPRQLRARSVVLATGFTPFDARQQSRFGYGRYPNVITGLDAEAQLRQSDALRRVSDGQQPERVAFVQCVGSRELKTGRNYCSRVCCAYALRMADRMLHTTSAQVTVFYMDIQSFGKEFDAFYSRCKANPRLRFCRAIPGSLAETDGHGLRAKYEEAPVGAMLTAEFDLVVLSIGITACQGNRALAGMLGLELDEAGFFKGLSVLEPYRTVKEGIFVAGTCRTPMNLGQALAEGEAIAQYV
jgi:heterodisulfide reductase subunit A